MLWVGRTEIRRIRVINMTIADTGIGTIGSLFFMQVKELTLATAAAAKRSRAYSEELGKILEAYAPESSKLFRQGSQRFSVYR